MTPHIHDWYEWVAYDEHVFESGMTNGYRYRRECSILGCSAMQYAENLVPTGKTETKETTE